MVVAIAGGLGTLIVAGLRAPSLGPVHASHWAVAGTMGVLLLASWLWPLVVFRGGESEAAHVDECFFVILALLVPPVLTLGTIALATTVAQAVRRRPLVKSAFNSGQVLTAAGLGLVVSRGLAMPSGSIGLAQAAAIAAGVTVFEIVNTALVTGLMAAMGMTWEEFTSDLRIQITLAGAGAVAGLVLALAIRAHVWAIALVVPGLIVGRWLIGARYAALYDRARMEGLYQVTLEANRQLRQQPVLDTILESVRLALRSPEAGLTRSAPDPGEPAAAMTIAGQRHWLTAAGWRATSPSTRLTAACCAPWPRWAPAPSATLSCTSRSASSANGSPRSRSTSGKASAPSPRTGASPSSTRPPPTSSTCQRSASMATSPPGRAVAAPDYLLRPARQAMRTRATIREDDARFRGRHGAAIPVAYTVSPVMSDARPSGAVITFRDITERKAFEDELHHYACYDDLTGLANRRLLVDRLDQALQRSTLDSQTHALIFVDVAPVQEHQRQPRARDRGRVPRRDRRPDEERGAGRRPDRAVRRRRVRDAPGGRGGRG